MNIYTCFETRWTSPESETSVNELSYVVSSCLPSWHQNAVNLGNAVKLDTESVCCQPVCSIVPLAEHFGVL